MHTLQLFLEQSPVLALFLVIALGYGLGAVRVAGVSFGVGAVLFIGLAVGAMAPKSVPPALVSSLGLPDKTPYERSIGKIYLATR
jgi:putative transport protein